MSLVSKQFIVHHGHSKLKVAADDHFCECSKLEGYTTDHKVYADFSSNVKLAHSRTYHG
jgi:hypothetical protein